MRTTRRFALSLALACFAASCGDEVKQVPPTQITARIRVDGSVRPQMAALRVRSFSARGDAWMPGVEHTYPADVVGALLDVAFVPAEGTRTDRMIELVVEALDGADAVLVQQRALVTFASREQRVLDVSLAPCGALPLRTLCEPDPACAGAACKTCVEALCQPTPVVAGSSLPPLDPSATPELDGGMDGAADASDGRVPERDGAEAGSEPGAVTCATPDAGLRCDDGNPCNGRETCDPTSPIATPSGCVLVEPAVTCGAGQTCALASGTCTTCELSSDGDRDMAASMACGGMDCDDNDAARTPGKAEICDGKDNDCSGVADDGPGPSAACASTAPVGATSTCESGRCVQRCVDPDSELKDGDCRKIQDCPAVDPCAPGTCVDGVRTFTCSCPSGTVAAPDMKRCVRVPAWSSAAALETQSAEARRPRIAMNRAGSAMVVWTQAETPTLASLWSRRYAAGAWEAPVLAESDAVGTVSNADVAIDGAGSAYAVWSHGIPGGPLVWGNRHAGSWGTAGSIDTSFSVDVLLALQVVASEGTGAIASWCRNLGSGSGAARVWASVLPASGALGSAISVSEYAPNIDAPDAVVDDQGRVTLVWVNGAGSSRAERAIYAARRVGDVWGTPERIDSMGPLADPTPTPSVAADGSGNTLAVWTSSGLYWTRFVVGQGGWNAPMKMPGSDAAQDTTTALWSNGDGLVLWSAPVSGGSGLYAGYFAPARGIEATRRLDRSGTVVSGTAQLAVGASGIAVAVWQEADGIWASRYTTPGGFGEAVRLGAGEAPDVGTSTSGVSIAVWQQGTDVMFSRFE